MRTLVISTLTSTLTFAFVAILFTPAPPEAAAAQEASMPPLVTQEEYERWLTELSNWGRWGPDDELGTLNLITPAKRTEAAALVTDGFSVSLASTAETERTVAISTLPIEWPRCTWPSRSALPDLAGLPVVDQTLGEPVARRRRHRSSHVADRTSRRGACRRDPGREQSVIPCRPLRKRLRCGERSVCAAFVPHGGVCFSTVI